MLTCCVLWDQAGAEQIMKNVAKRMMNGGLASVIISWRTNCHAEKTEAVAQERAERIMKRVGGRWKSREMSDAVQDWHGKQLEEKAAQRAEMVMKRVGARLRNKELALNWAEWARNFRSDRSTMWENRVAKLQAALDELQLQFTLKTQVSTSAQPRLLVMLERELYRCVHGVNGASVHI